MDDARAAFLFGDDFDPEDAELDGWDLDDADDRAELLDEAYDDATPVAAAVRRIVAEQIATDDPPEVWATVERLRAAGYDRGQVFDQLVLAFLPELHHVLAQAEEWDAEGYLQALDRLPLPTPEEIEDATVAAVREAPGIEAEALRRLVLERLAGDADDEVVGGGFDHVIDELVVDGPLAWLAGDRTVHVGDLTDGIVLTHVLSDVERQLGVLTASFDLAGFARLDDLRLPSGAPVEAFSVERGHLAWRGPDGWLDGYDDDMVLAVRVGPDGTVDIEALADVPALDAPLVDRVRAAHEDESAESGLPLAAEDLVLALLLDDPRTFAAPVAPLADLVAAAGLQRRQDQVAGSAAAWHRGVLLRRTARVLEEVEDRSEVDVVLRALAVADLAAGLPDDTFPEGTTVLDDETMARVLADLQDDGVLPVVLEELLDQDRDVGAPVDEEADDVDGLRRMAAFVEVLGAAASRRRDRGLVHLLAAVLAERRGEPLVAEAELEAAAADGLDLGFLIDRQAWGASDRGDAAQAVRAWRQLDASPAVRQDLSVVEPFARPVRATMGRNERCWCGSGRKYKQCHLGAAGVVPLPDRVHWLWHKAVTYVQRRGAEARDDMIAVGLARTECAEDEDRARTAIMDPLVMDLVLTEGRWFRRFLVDRGALLPADEAILAQSWALVDRTVYEVRAVRPGQGLDLYDLRTATDVEVRERAGSGAVGVGELICARAVSDGASHVLVGGAFAVAPGTESTVLDLLDRGHPEEIASYVAGLERPPVLTTREGEPSVACELVLRVDDPHRARSFLDLTYEPDDGWDGDDDAPDTDGGWVEMFELTEDESILRARLRLEADELTVTANSEARVERVLAVLAEELGDLEVLVDERTPIDAATLRRQMAAQQAEVASNPDLLRAMEELRGRHEESWCDEEIPALGGLTPRQAAADPTRRPQLERLLTSFEGADLPGAITMRPARLRQLLDL